MERGDWEGAKGRGRKGQEEGGFHRWICLGGHRL